jgi:hypothetical protein
VDFNGDGKDDLFIGVPGEDFGSAADSGTVDVLHVSPSGITATTTADQFWYQSRAGVGHSEEGAYDSNTPPSTTI